MTNLLSPIISLDPDIFLNRILFAPFLPSCLFYTFYAEKKRAGAAINFIKNFFIFYEIGLVFIRK